MGSTYVFYNIYYYLRFSILGLSFLNLFSGKWQKLFIWTFLLISVFMFLINMIYVYGFGLLHSNYQLIGGIFIITLCMIHFYTILKNTKRKNPLITPLFWTSIGLFFYFLCTLPFFGIVNLLVKKDIIFVEQYLIIVKSVSIFLYSMFSLDFYVQWKYQKLEF